MDNLNNFTYYILTIIAIILAIPLLPYLISIYSKKGGGSDGNGGDESGENNEHLIDAYDTHSITLEHFNTFDEIYLFCTYILFRRVKICADDANAEDMKYYNKHLTEVSNTLDFLNRNLKSTIERIEDLKKEALKGIIENRRKREEREHTEHIENMKEYNANARHSSDNFRKWFIIFIDNFKSFFVAFFEAVAFATRMIVEIVRLIVPAIAALLRNPVFVGFIILVWLIYFILGLIKDAYKKKEPVNAVANKDAEKDDEDGKGTNSFYSIFKDIIDTFNYFKNMLNNFKMSSAGLFGVQEGDEAGLTDREEIKGKSYDNLSFILLSDVFATSQDVKNYFGVDVPIDSDKYYNILLPEERFKNNKDMSFINNGKWKVVNRVENNKEKVWRIDCNRLDTVGNNIPAYVSGGSSGGDKCSVNQKGIGDYHTSLIPKKERVKVSTEDIR
jgi:ABC-type multidrug transport system fused ATPase/permease subunit